MVPVDNPASLATSLIVLIVYSCTDQIQLPILARQQYELALREGNMIINKKKITCSELFLQLS